MRAALAVAILTTGCFDDVVLGNRGECGDACRPAGLDCSAPPDAFTVAFYGFDDIDGGAIDSVGGIDGYVVGGLELGPGADGCGSGLSFSSEGHVVIGDDPRFHLDEGSIDFQVWLPSVPPARAAALVSRDASGDTRGGHLTVFYDQSGAIAVRWQTTAGEIVGENTVCTPAALPTGVWLTVAVNFTLAGLELYLDGERVDAEGSFHTNSDSRACGLTAEPQSLGDNENPWIVGAYGGTTPEGEASPVGLPFVGGRIDSLRISRSPRRY